MDEWCSCPRCGGRGGSTGIRCGPDGCKTMTLKCDQCQDGRVPADIFPRMAASIEHGREARDDRVARGVSLREEAKRLRISVRELADIECGRKLLEVSK